MRSHRGKGRELWWGPRWPLRRPRVFLGRFFYRQVEHHDADYLKGETEEKRRATDSQVKEKKLSSQEEFTKERRGGGKKKGEVYEGVKKLRASSGIRKKHKS